MPAGRKSGSLRLWVALFVGAILAAFMLIFFSIFHTTMPRMLLESEDKYLSQQLKLVDGLLASARQSVALLAEDTATWEEAALFAEGRNPDFITNNWPGKSLLESFRLNFVIIKDKQGNDLYADFLELPAKRKRPVPAGLSSRLDGLARQVAARYSPDVHDDDFGMEGILLFDGIAYDVAVMPIIPSREAEKPSGILILGNVLNNAYFQHLTHDHESTFSIVEDADGDHAPALRLDEETASTRTPIPGVDGRRLVLVMTEKRQIYAEGKQYLNRAYLLILGAMLLFSLALYIALGRLVLSPIGRLCRDIRNITKTEDVANAEIVAEDRVFKSREFVILYASINGMLRKLGQSNVSLTMLHGLLDGIDANIYVVDPDDDTILFMNDKMQKHFGLTENPVGKTCWKVLQNGFTERCSFCPSNRLRAFPDEAVVWEEKNTRTGKQYRNTDCLIEWEGKKKVHLQYSVDITNLKDVEASLKKRLEQQELMAEMTRSFIATAGMADLINNALRMAGEFMGISKIILARRYEEEEVLNAEYEWYNADHSCFRPEETRVPFHAGTPEYQGFIVEKQPHLAYDDISGREEFRYAHGHGIYSLAGVPVYVFGYFWGILSFGVCGRVRPWSESDIQLITLIGSIISGVVERSIRETELMRMSSIVDSAPQFISYADQDGKIEFANKGTEKALGYTPDELVAGGLRLVLGDADFDAVNRDILARVKSEGSFSFELPLRKKDGEGRIFSFSCFSIQQDLGIGAITQDVTEQRMLEKEIIRAKEQAEKSSLAKSEFLSRMSHEMRTPLNAIIGMTSIASAADNKEKKQYCLDKIGDASNHLLGVINDILDMSKIEANKFELSFTEFPFEQMLIRVLNVVNFRIEEKNQTLGVSVSPDIPYSLVGDEQRLAQVIANLLSNAVKFTPERGSITLSARKTAEENGECTLLIEVKDTGIGISRENQAKLFTAFEQADGGIARKFGGTGLGLSISKRIVAMMGGDIWVRSEPGQGATFSFTIRARRGSATRETALRSDIDWNSLRILAVDDMPDVREYFLDLAANMGFACTVAKDGYEALRILQEAGENGFDVIFVDWRMPGMDGLQFAAELAKKGARRPVVIMISAFEQESIEKEAAAVGIKKFLPKPLFATAIVDAVSDALRRSPAAPRNTAYGETGCFAGYAILLAEDIEINREIVITMLEDTGITVDCAENGAQACELFRENPEKYAMIFMDIHMPEVDGYEATRRIRAMDIPRARTVPIIAMTANVFREDIERCLDAGMDGHIGKPINFEALFAKLREGCAEQPSG